jgi:hypothetical protein
MVNQLSGRQGASQPELLRVVTYRREGWWMAQCLEYDITATAKTESDLARELQRVIVGYMVVAEELGLAPFAHLPPAPSRFLTMWEQAREIDGPWSIEIGPPDLPRPQIQTRLAA